MFLFLVILLGITKLFESFVIEYVDETDKDSEDDDEADDVDDEERDCGDWSVFILAEVVSGIGIFVFTFLLFDWFGVVLVFGLASRLLADLSLLLSKISCLAFWDVLELVLFVTLVCGVAGWTGNEFSCVFSLFCLYAC